MQSLSSGSPFHSSCSLGRVPFRVSCNLPCVTVETHRSHEDEIWCVDHAKHDHRFVSDELRLHPISYYQRREETHDATSIISA